MEKERIQVSEDITIEVYRFSDYISCAEIFYQKESFHAFCSDHQVFEEWMDNPEGLEKLCRDYLKKHPSKKMTSPAVEQEPSTIKLNDQYSIHHYPFSDDLLYVNVMQDGRKVHSFCTDYATFEEWEDDPASFIATIHKMLNK